jgi:hypothetical protein
MGGGALQTSNFLLFYLCGFKLALDNAITVEDPVRKLIYHRLLSLFFSLFIDKKAARYKVVSVPQKEDDFYLFFP